MTMQQYCLRWNNHQPNFIAVFSSLLNSESLVDVTLAAEGRHLQAHKVVLSACSSYFQSLFTINPCQHPIVILKDVQFLDLKIIVDFMYYGEVNVSQEQLPHILKTAEMLKIKGLAEMPVDQSVAKKDSTSIDRAELLTSGNSSWNSESIQHHRSLSPSPCPMSPANKRKRFRKSSTGSGSGSLEKSTDDLPLGESTPSFSVEIPFKSENESYVSDSNMTHKKQLSGDSELQRGNTHESSDGNAKHQITLQIPQQDINISHSIDSSGNMDVTGQSNSSVQQHTVTVTEKPLVTTHAQLSQQFLHQSQLTMGTKRGRFLMRQQRIKREGDFTQIAEDDGSSHYLSVPHVKIERQSSEPLPCVSPPPGTLLSVPGSILIKQHSHPLLPSQMAHQPSSPPLNLPPFHQQHHQHQQVHQPHHQQQKHQQLSIHTTTEPSDGAVSPILLVTESIVAQPDVPIRADSFPPTQFSTLRVRSDELKRSASSPQAGTTRSSHCPVVRTGPALGCNYCWNTVDTHGRILRRKTKYHCPECQTNLCIVPCFQEYHERHQAAAGQTDPIALTTSVMRVFPKTSSM